MRGPRQSKKFIVVIAMAYVGLILLFLLSQLIMYLFMFNFPHNALASSFTVIWYDSRTLLILLTPLAIACILLSWHRLAAVIGSIIISIYYLVELGLTYFIVSRRTGFDFFYFWLNRREAFETLTKMYHFFMFKAVCIVVAALLLMIAIAMVMRMSRRMTVRMPLWIRTCVVLVLTVHFFSVTTPLGKVVHDAYVTYHVLAFTPYHAFYDRSLQPIAPFLSSLPVPTNNAIMMLQLESLNSVFVDPRFTPQVYAVGQRGILFTKHHSTAVMTQRADEVILCGALPSLNLTANHSESYDYAVDYAADQNIPIRCLPQVLRDHGYATLYFENYDIQFQQMDSLMKTMGFDEVHGLDIVQPGDPHLEWGVREDVYFERVREYLAVHVADLGKPLFVYIVVGSSNHNPFTITEKEVRSDVWRSLPFPKPTTYIEQRENTAFIQDAYVKDFWGAMSTLPFFARATTFVFGDHPVAISAQAGKYSYNIDGSTEQYFLTSMAIVPPPGTMERPGIVITDDVGSSHTDIAATALDLVGLPNVYRYSNTLVPLMTGVLHANLCTLSVQPFSNPAISLVQYPDKIVITPVSGSIFHTILDGDIVEHPLPLQRFPDDTRTYLDACLRQSLSSYLASGSIKSVP
jgi:hypothetical protein